MQSPNSARCFVKSGPRVPVLPTKVTVILIERSFEFLLPVFNSCDNFGLHYSYVRNGYKTPRLVKHDEARARRPLADGCRVTKFTVNPSMDGTTARRHHGTGGGGR